MNERGSEEVEQVEQVKEVQVEEEVFDTECGLGLCRRWRGLQRLANKTSYVTVYGVLGCITTATYAYSNSTISTIEKRFKIPSSVTGMITVGNDISSLLAALLLSYYLGKGHRPRWIAAGIYTVALYCFINLVPHVLWGAGEDALSLTIEHGGAPDEHLTAEIMLMQKRKTLCRAGLNDSLAGAECLVPGSRGARDSGLAPAVLFFLANFVSGIGGSLYFSLGVSYMDDNIKKSKTPFLVSISYFMRMLGPAVGYSLGSFFLKMYVSPSLTPTITNTDPRWLGAWWAGWVILGACLVLLGSIMGLFPRTMPRTAQRRREALQKGSHSELTPMTKTNGTASPVEKDKASLKDMYETIKRLVTNKIYMCNTLAGIFYMFGFTPFWIYTAKYIEMQYRVSASRASFFTGSVGLVFSAVGILLAGLLITRFKPNARLLAGWNVVVAVISVLSIVSYPLLGCAQSDLQSTQMAQHTVEQCNLGCRCDYVKYSPVCSEDRRTTFISACHAGCTDYLIEKGQKIFTGCTCVSPPLYTRTVFPANLTIQESRNHTSEQGSQESRNHTTSEPGGRAFPGPCPVDCTAGFYSYIAIVCLLKFVGATGRTSNFLVSVRCVEERDKPTSMGFGMMLFNLFVFIPSPIVFGYIIDSTCVVWGLTCSGKGNCWQYDGEDMRNLMNYTAAVLVAIGTVFDCGVWYYVKELMIFDEEEEEEGKKREEGELGREMVEVHAIPPDSPE